MTPVFFVHGMWSTPAVFDRLRARLAVTGRPTYAPALPFHDRAPDLAPPPELGTITVEDYIAFLVAEIALLPEPPIIAGHSMGGFLAQAVAARVGAPGLILFSPAATASTNVPAIPPIRTMMEVIIKPKWWERPTKIDADHARWGIYNEVPAPIADAEIAALVWDSGRVLFEMALPFIARTGSTQVDHSRLTMPALIITGDRDRITPSANIELAYAEPLQLFADLRAAGEANAVLLRDRRPAGLALFGAALARMPLAAGRVPAMLRLGSVTGFAPDV